MHVTPRYQGNAVVLGPDPQVAPVLRKHWRMAGANVMGGCRLGQRQQREKLATGIGYWPGFVTTKNWTHLRNEQLEVSDPHFRAHTTWGLGLVARDNWLQIGYKKQKSQLN